MGARKLASVNKSDVDYILHKIATKPALSQYECELNFIDLFTLAKRQRRKND